MAMAVRNASSAGAGSAGFLKVDAAVERLPGATGDVVDLKDGASIAGFLDRLDPFDHLAITAGDFDKRVFASTEDLDLAFAREAFEVRFWGSLAVIKHGRHKLAPNGSITLTSGVLAHRPSKGSPPPTAVTGAVEHLVRGFAVDLAPQRINGVCPGANPDRTYNEQDGQRGAGYADSAVYSASGGKAKGRTTSKAGDLISCDRDFPQNVSRARNR